MSFNSFSDCSEQFCIVKHQPRDCAIMPYTYRRKSSRKTNKPAPKRKTYSRRRVTRRPRRSLYNVAPSGMPRVRVARLRYVQRCSNETITTALFSLAFNANGPFQPNGAVTGGFTHIDPHQPMGFDQWAALFNNYVVKGSKITVTRVGCEAVTANLADQTEAGRFGIYVSDSSAPAYSRGTSYQEARKGMTKYVSNNQRTSQAVQAFYSPRRVYGIKDIKDNQQRLGASVTTNPTELASYVLWMQFDNAPPVTTTWLFDVVIDYLIQFDEPVDLAQSTA